MATVKSNPTTMPLTTPAVGNDEEEFGVGFREDVAIAVSDFLISETKLQWSIPL